MPTTTKYIWDDENLLAEADASDTVNVVYTNEPERFGNLVSTRIGKSASYHHYDAIGSTRQVTNAADHVTGTAIDDAWGNIVMRTGAVGISLQWIGELGYYFDLETGLVYVRRRQYGPAVGRWTAADPIPPIDGLLWFVYAENSPTYFSDPSGLMAGDGGTPQESFGQAGMGGGFLQQTYIPTSGDICAVDPLTGNILLFRKARLDRIIRNAGDIYGPDPSRESLRLNDPPIVDTVLGSWDRRSWMYGDPPDILRRPPGGGGFLRAPAPAGTGVLKLKPQLGDPDYPDPRIAEKMRRGLRGENLGGESQWEIFISGEGGISLREGPDVKGGGLGFRIPLYRRVNGKLVFVGFVDMGTNPEKWLEDKSFWPRELEEPESGGLRIRE